MQELGETGKVPARFLGMERPSAMHHWHDRIPKWLHSKKRSEGPSSYTSKYLLSLKVDIIKEHLPLH